jgi:hypothetical protein
MEFHIFTQIHMDLILSTIERPTHGLVVLAGGAQLMQNFDVLAWRLGAVVMVFVVA